MITLEKAKAIIAELGGKPCDGACWEDERTVYASSVETVPGTYGHPRYEVQFSKESGWLSVSGRNPIKVEVGGAVEYVPQHYLGHGARYNVRRGVKL